MKYFNKALIFFIYEVTEWFLVLKRHKEKLFKRVLRDWEEIPEGGGGKVSTTRRSQDEIPELCETFFLRGL